MLIALSGRAAICQSVAEVQLTGLAPLGAVSHRLALLTLLARQEKKRKTATIMEEPGDGLHEEQRHGRGRQTSLAFGSRWTTFGCTDPNNNKFQMSLHRLVIVLTPSFQSIIPPIDLPNPLFPINFLEVLLVFLFLIVYNTSPTFDSVIYRKYLTFLHNISSYFYYCIPILSHTPTFDAF